PSANTVRLGSFQDLLKNSMYVENFQLIDSDDLNCPEPLIVKIRYRKQATPCRVEPTDNNRLKVTFLEPLSAIAAGQGAAFYIGDRVIGGGIIGE
ncbi:MAG: tRNA 2-thiouridine(34) synthase MnmA, partial [Bacteroidota bacterium]|nr:tRNA 2-thiouridine(34) synthase MnmA [Bacteroidota bacterium]